MKCIADAKLTLQLERQAINEQKISISKLIDKAGNELANLVMELKPNGLVVVVSGKGNNGGDGFAAANYLNKSGIKVKVIALYKLDELTIEAKKAFLLLKKELIATSTELKTYLKKAQIIVDAIFGFSFKPPVREFELNVFKEINRQNAKVISADVPSGLEASTGEAKENEAIKADRTLCFTCIKKGLLTGSGPNYAGRIKVAKIGIKDEVAEKYAFASSLQIEDAKKLLPKREQTMHKKTSGRVLVVSGSSEFSGAPIMVAEAAYRAGAGYVTLAVPQAIKALIQEKITPEVIVRGFGKPCNETFTKDESASILALAKEHDCLAIGPGLSVQKKALEFIYKIVGEADTPIVVDADALSEIANEKSLLKNNKNELVLTPHSAELSKITGLSIAQIEADRFKAAKILASKKVTVLLKGRYTVIASDDELKVNLTSNNGMATAGTGDVLTGVIAALIAQKLKPADAAALGAYIHGLSGDIAVLKLSEYALIATDIVRNLAYAFKKIEVS